ncbi:HNH endonuclease [Oerskovia sp. NPDC060338]|uniref:HNH endonuclease n=1 Tax=Oerskovia sp. NPDC060338 TaxID=3347100 RepID=UPI0036516D89
MTALVMRTYGPRCHLCLRGIRLDLPRRHPDGPSADHLIARKYGGTNDLSNLRPAHTRCNSRRGARPLTADLLASFRRRPEPETGGPFFRDG